MKNNPANDIEGSRLLLLTWLDMSEKYIAPQVDSDVRHRIKETILRPVARNVYWRCSVRVGGELRRRMK